MILLFLVAVTMGMIGCIALLAHEVATFPWTTFLGRFRFTLGTLMAITAVLGVALGLDRLERQANSLLSLPFAAILFTCGGVAAFMLALAHEFGVWNNGPSSLDRYRSREQAGIELDSVDSIETQDVAEAAPKSSKKKWWRQRLPSRFRSLRHRDPRTSVCSDLYSRD